MTRPTELAPEVLRELQRLDKLAHKAHSEHNLATEATCRQRWVALYQAAGGARSPLPEIVLTNKQAERHRIADHTPIWRVRQKLAPLVAIVDVYEVRYKNDKGYETNHWVEILACGHEHIYHGETWEYPNRSKRRRCLECGDLAMIAAGYAGKLDHHDDVSPNNTASLARPLSQVPDSTITLTFPSARTPPPNPRVIEMPKPVATAKHESDAGTGTLKASVGRTNNG